MKQYLHTIFKTSLLYGLLIALNYCGNPTGYDINEPYPEYDQYVVSGYVYQNGNVVVNKSVWLYIKDYQYTAWQTTFECKTNAIGLYRFTVSFKDWDYYYYNLTCYPNQCNGQIVFGKVERKDFEL